MNKKEFIEQIRRMHKCDTDTAKKVIEMFTSSVMDALASGEEVTLIGFGNFSVSKVRGRDGRNPKTGEAIQIRAYNQPKFKAGQTLKNAVNRHS